MLLKLKSPCVLLSCSDDKVGENIKMNIFIDLADIEVQLSGGGCERLQMQAMVASFYSGMRKTAGKASKKSKGF
jgi:hypothetical protein